MCGIQKLYWITFAPRQSQGRDILPCEAATCPEKVHEGNADETVYVKDQVGFLMTRERS